MLSTIKYCLLFARFSMSPGSVLNSGAQSISNGGGNFIYLFLCRFGLAQFKNSQFLPETLTTHALRVPAHLGVRATHAQTVGLYLLISPHF